MEVKDVKSLPWKKVTDWSALCESYTNFFGADFVTKKDVKVFVDNVYREIARQLNIPYEQLKPILETENEPFNTLKKKAFKGYAGLKKESAQLIALENTLRVPDVSSIVAEDKVSSCFKLFEELSDIEKTAFLQKIGKINSKN